MTTTTLTYTGELTILTCWCGIKHAVPSDLRDFQMRQHNAGQSPISIYCPLGHQHIPSGEGETAKLKRNLEWAKDDAARAKARADQAEASLRTTKGHVTRLRKQVLAGECPLCGRHLRDLERHIGRVHKDEPVELPE